MEVQRIALFLFVGLFTLVSSNVYYVTPSSSVPCPEKESPCLTLSQYANEPSDYFASNTTLILLPGNHRFGGDLSLTKTMKFVAILASNENNKQTILCQNGSRFKFKAIDNVIIHRLTFIGCMWDIQSVSDFVIDNCTFTNSSGPMISISKSKVMFLESFIKGNNVTHGHLVRCHNSQTVFEKSVISNNTAGAIYNVIYCSDSNMTVNETKFYGNNNRGMGEGNLLELLFTDLIIQNSIFSNNPCIRLVECSNAYSANMIHICSSEFIQNSCPAGAVVYGTPINTQGVSELLIDNTSFIENFLTKSFNHVLPFFWYEFGYNDLWNQSANHSQTVVIQNSLYKSNYNIGMLFVRTYYPAKPLRLTVLIQNTTFEHNQISFAINGKPDFNQGLIRMQYEAVGISTNRTDFQTLLVTVNGSTFYNNSCFGAIGIMSLSGSIAVTAIFDNTLFDDNKLNSKLSNWIFVQGISVKGNGIEFSHNQGTLFYIVNSDIYITNSKFLANNGSFFVSNSNVTFMGSTTFDQNYAKTSDEGGALTCLQSDIAFFDSGTLINNYAEYYGGGIFATECSISVLGELKITNNTANISGGGIFVVQGEINIRGENVEIANNQARVNGGGLYATGSTVKLFQNSLVIENNTAGENGGGCYLEYNTRLYVIKSQCHYHENVRIHLKLLNNSADFGGALYVDDKTGLCVKAADASEFNTHSLSTSNNWCFLQVLSTYAPSNKCDSTKNKSVYFIDNKATSKGHDLYGGLLDRCMVSPYAELIQVKNFTSLTGKSYLENVSDIDISTESNLSAVASDAVRVCFCKNNKPDCNFHPPVKAWKGKTTTLSAVAVDQIERPVEYATIRIYLLQNSINIGQSHHEINATCTNLTFNILSSLKQDKVYLYADGPCDSAGISKQYFNVTFLHCPIGFREVQDMKYHSGNCECDPRLAKYINCSVENGTVQRISGSNSWIMYSDSDEFITYEHCPFDYCHPPSENTVHSINFSKSDSLCAFSRTGKLCGSCKDGLSLTLGSSQCKPCSNYWLFLLIPFVLGGIVLVAFLLVCNLTTAVGTINGLIFYANVVIASPATFFSYKTETPVFFSEVLSWINLDLGIEACFFNGMNAYVYTWLQFVFPIYIIFLVVMVIFISEHSQQFAKLLSTRNPVATLATLILLSYAKLLRTVITIFLPAELKHINGTSTEFETVWLIDGSVAYLKGKHVYLFVAGVVTLILVLGYTILLLAWQWIGKAPKWKVFNWTRSVKLISFMETYHAPFKPKYRYWAGVLLIARIVLYVIMAVNIQGDIKANLLAIAVVIIFLVALVKGVYKNWVIEAVESAFFVNLSIFAVTTFYVKTIIANQTAVSYISTGVTFVLLCAILVYHTYAFILKKRVCQGNQVNYNALEDSNDCVHDREGSDDENLREPLNLITETPNTEDYRQAAASHRPNPVVTQAVIEGRPRGGMLNPQHLQPVRNEKQDQ